jgi:phage-related tail protein
LHLRDDDGIVVVEAGPGDASEGMDGRRGSPALHARLGQEGAAGLLELLETARQEWTAEVVGAVGERFERRLVQETSAVRVEMAQLGAGLRQEMAELGADLRQEMAELGADLRQEMAGLGADLRREMAEMGADLRQEMAEMRADLLQGDASLRLEMREGFATIRQEMADQRFELLKWAFIFWVGQFFAVASLLAIAIRFIGPR